MFAAIRLYISRQVFENSSNKYKFDKEKIKVIVVDSKTVCLSHLNTCFHPLGPSRSL